MGYRNASLKSVQEPNRTLLTRYWGSSFASFPLLISLIVRTSCHIVTYYSTRQGFILSIQQLFQSFNPRDTSNFTSTQWVDLMQVLKSMLVYHLWQRNIRYHHCFSPKKWGCAISSWLSFLPIPIYLPETSLPPHFQKRHSNTT